jgi:hypothetical protein
MITCTFLSTAALEVLKQVSRKVAFSCKKSWSASKVVDEDIAIASAVSSRWSPTVGGFTIEGFRPSISSLVQLPRQCTRQGEIESLKSSDATPFVIRSGVVTMVVVFVPLSVERRAGGVHLAVEKEASISCYTLEFVKCCDVIPWMLSYPIPAIAPSAGRITRAIVLPVS